MKILVLDIGNTFTKVALFSDSTLHFVDRNSSENGQLKHIFSKIDFSDVDFCVYSSVRKLSTEDLEYLRRYTFHSLKSIWPSDFIVRYDSFQSIGEDRLACMLGAYYLSNFFAPLLAIQLGTAITYDYMLEPKVIEGGAISPGLRIRFAALHNYTDLLPLVKVESYNEMIAHSTREAILSGVLIGTKAELEHRIQSFFAQFPLGKVYLTGGDIKIFSMSDEKQIFANSNLVLWGLYYATLMHMQ
jgi:type III pantothenate kinase